MKKPLEEISLRKNPPKVSHFIISKNFALRQIKKKNSKVNQLKKMLGSFWPNDSVCI